MNQTHTAPSCTLADFYAGDWVHSEVLTYGYATHHRHSCIGARAGFGDLLIGARALMCEANGLDPGGIVVSFTSQWISP